MDNQNSEEKKAHIFEIDFLRAVTVFSVVTIHTFSSCTYLLANSKTGTKLINLFVHSLHYNREIFIFVTGLVLTYVYYHRTFSTKKFLLRRFLLIFIPYALWTLLYELYHNTLGNFWMDILTGGASYQLYYISLALEYYLLFPLILKFIRKAKKHLVLIIGISFIVQLLFNYVDYAYFQTGTLSHLPLIKLYVAKFQKEFFMSYQFFFLFGAVVAVHINKVYRFMQKYGYFSPIIFGIALLLYALYFFHQLDIKEGTLRAMNVIQPSVLLYSTVIIFVFSWLSILWAQKKRFFSIIKAISDVSFGIFFVHIMILDSLILYFVPQISSMTPVLGTIILVDLLTFTASVLFCLLLMRTRFLSWTIGRAIKR